MILKKIISATAVAILAAGCSTFMPVEKITLPENAKLLDVRTAKEYDKEHIEGAILVPHDRIDNCICEVTRDKDAPIYVYCGTGKRAGIALEKLKKLGYTNVITLGAMKDAKERIK